jgi:hypothetical protein
VFSKEPYTFLAVLLNFMFMIIINANFRRDNGTLSDRSLVKLIDVILSAYAVISKRRLASIKIKRVPFVTQRPSKCL